MMPANDPAGADPLTVADLLPQLPPELARADSVSPHEPVRIAPAILSQALSSGQLAVPLFEVFRVCPGIFQGAVSPDDPRLVGLPPSKLPALISTASAAPALPSASPFQPLPAVNTPTPSPSPFATASTAMPASPFASLFTESSQQPPASMEAGHAVTLPPRRDPSQPPANSLPPSPFLDAPTPFLPVEAPSTSPFATAPIAQPEPAAPPQMEQPFSPFTLPAAPEAAVPASPSIPFSLFQEAPPESPAPSAFAAASPPSEPPPSPFLDEAAAPAPVKKITGAATASVAALLKGQSADALGFDPAMVPTWITTQFHGGLVAELQDLPEPVMDLGTIVDGITDIGFRNVLNSARRDHSVPVPMEALTAVGAPSPTASAPVAPAAPAPAFIAQPAPAIANPFMTAAAAAPAAPEVTPNPFKIEPGNPFASVPDAPPPAPPPEPAAPASLEPAAKESTMLEPEPPAAAPPSAFTVVPKPQGPALIQPKADIESVLAAVAAPATPAASAAPPINKAEAKIFDPFAPTEPASPTGGFSSFDLLGGKAQDSLPPTPEVAPVEAVELPEIPTPFEEPAAPEKPAFILPETPADFLFPPANQDPKAERPEAVRRFIDLPPEDLPSAEPFSTAAPPNPMPAATLPPRIATPTKSALGIAALAPTGEEQLVLRALLDSDEDLDTQRVIDLTSALPGIAACALIRDEKVVASSSSKGAEAKAFRTQAAEVAKNLRSLAPLIGIADAETFTLNTDTRLISLCFPGAVTLAILHDREPTLGQRDKLTLIARQLERLTSGS